MPRVFRQIATLALATGFAFSLAACGGAGTTGGGLSGGPGAQP